MRRTTILNAKQVKRTSFSEAEQLFTKHCKLKNLSPQTMRYYAEDLKYFHACVPVQYVDEVSQDAFESFIVSELDAGKTGDTLSSHIMGTLADVLSCDEAFETAIETAAGSAMQNVITATREDAQYLISYLKATRAGQATFLPLDAVRPRMDSPQLKSACGERGAVGIAMDLVNYDRR